MEPIVEAKACESSRREAINPIYPKESTDRQGSPEAKTDGTPMNGDCLCEE